MRIVPLLTSDHNDTKRNDNITFLKTKHFFFEIFYHYNKGLIKFRYEQNRN